MPIQARTVSFDSRGRALEAYLAQPDGAGAFPAVVVIHEIFGLTDNIKNVARRFAEAGYGALAVDLFAGRNRAVCMFRFMSGLYLNSLNHGAIRDLKASLSFLAAQPGVDPKRLGAIGFCMGGSFAIAWACTDDRLKVIAPFYAQNPRPLEAVARLCPVVGSYPEPDFTTAAGRKLDAALDDYSIPHDIKVYPGTRHGFFNADNAHTYDPAASADAWERTLAFFKRRLG